MIAQIKLLVITSILITSNSCSVNKQQGEKDFIKPEQVAFIEFIHTQDGEAISGTAPQGRRIDGPTYRFDKETKQLEIRRKESFSIDTVKVLLGTVKILKGVAGTGLSMRINAIGKLPYSLDNLTISKVSSKGISITFDKKKHLLKEGEEWEITIDATTNMDTPIIIKMKPQYKDEKIAEKPETENKTNIPTIIKFTDTYKIIYHGLIDKKGVTQ